MMKEKLTKCEKKNADNKSEIEVSYPSNKNEK